MAAVKEIYTGRAFATRDGGRMSSQRVQHSGMSQGCPLSPFLFSMVMTVVMTDARDILSENAKQACEDGRLEDALP